MNLNSLLLSRDVEVMRILRPALEKLAIDVQVCQEAREASEILLSEKFDAVIVDCDDLPGGFEVLQELRATPSNKSSVAFAILNGKKTTTQDVFKMGINFVMQKPISSLNASRCLHAALNFMTVERRRYFRQPVKMAVKLIAAEKEVEATSTDISEGGMALMVRRALPKNATPHVHFTLPESSIALSLETQVAWADLKGRVGLRFMNMADSSRESLEKWLDRQMAKDLPKVLAAHGPESVQ